MPYQPLNVIVELIDLQVLPFDVNAQMQPLSFEELAQWDIGGDLWAFNL